MILTTNNRTRAVGTLARAVVAAGALLAGCSEDVPTTGPIVRPVKIYEVGTPDAGRTREYPGLVRATRSAEIGFEVPGRVVSIDAKQGQRVKANDVLATLDNRDYVAQLDIELANLRKAQADLRRSESVYAEDPGAITVERIDGNRRAVDVATAKVAQSRKAVEDTKLRAPFDGVVSRRLVEVFENVQAKQPVLIVENLAGIEVEINVPERDIGGRANVVSGVTAAELDKITRRIMPVVRISAAGGGEYPGKVVEVAARADTATRTFALRIAFDPGPDATVLPGMTARVTTRFEPANRISIPLSALVATPEDRAQVWIVDPATMTVHARVIEVGQIGEGTVEVRAGLEPGDLVATTGAKQLAEGMRVSRYEGKL